MPPKSFHSIISLAFTSSGARAQPPLATSCRHSTKLISFMAFNSRGAHHTPSVTPRRSSFPSTVRLNAPLPSTLLLGE
jgi:hypothetical protein